MVVREHLDVTLNLRWLSCLFLAKYYQGQQITENQIGGARHAHWGQKKWL